MISQEDSSASGDAAKQPVPAIPMRTKVVRARMIRVPSNVSSESLELAERISRESKRRDSAPVRKRFVRATDTEQPMLSTLYSGTTGRGGRSGVVAVKVLLTLLWRTSKAPYTTEMASSALATLLELPDPSGRGALRVREALKTLREHDLITLHHQPGEATLIELKNETGNGEEYDPPSEAHRKVGKWVKTATPADHEELYFRIPQEIWTEGFMQKLTGPGLVMLLILLAERANEKFVHFSTAEFERRYRISASTRTKGTQNLKDLGLVLVRSVPLPPDWGDPGNKPNPLARKRRRYQYLLKGPFLTSSTSKKIAAIMRGLDPDVDPWQQVRIKSSSNPGE